MAKTSCKKGQYYCNTDKKCKPIPRGFTVREDGFLVREGWSAKYKKSIDCNNPKGFSQKAHCAGKKKKMTEESNPRIARKKGQPAKSKKHSDLYTDEDPKGTIHGLGFKDVATAKASVAKIRKSGRSHAHKIQAAIAMEQRARVMGKTSEAAVYRKFINSMKKKTKAMNEEKHGDHEYEMIRRQVDNIMVNAKKLKKKVGKGEGEAKAWVQSKITKAADYLDTAADYMTDKESVKEGTLRSWFKGSKSKDGKGGWVNVKTGGTCASDEPGEGVPKCVSRAKYDSMSKKERESAHRRKRAADPNQQSKTGAAKPTYVPTDKPKKKKKKKMKEEFVSLPLQLEVPQSDGEFKLGLMFRESLEQDRGMLFIFESDDYWTFHMKNTFIPLDIAFIKEDGTIDSIKELDPMSPVPVYPDSEIRYAVEVNRGWFAENGVEVGDRILEEAEEINEVKDKKGKGSGTKDACYYKVKSRYSVWPSAYASGALVKCRKVGAANWGNSRKEEVEYEVNEEYITEVDRELTTAAVVGGKLVTKGIKAAKEVGKLIKQGVRTKGVPGGSTKPKKIGDTFVVKGGRRVKVTTKTSPSADYNRKSFMKSQKDKLEAQKKGISVKELDASRKADLEAVKDRVIRANAPRTGIDPRKGKSPIKQIDARKLTNPKFEHYSWRSDVEYEGENLKEYLKGVPFSGVKGKSTTDPSDHMGTFKQDAKYIPKHVGQSLKKSAKAIVGGIKAGLTGGKTPELGTTDYEKVLRGRMEKKNIEKYGDKNPKMKAKTGEAGIGVKKEHYSWRDSFDLDEQALNMAQRRAARGSSYQAPKPQPKPAAPAPQAKPAAPAPQAKPAAPAPKMGRTEVANRQKLGNERVDALKAKNAQFQAAKKSGNLAQFRKDNPKLSGRERAQQMAKARIAAKNAPAAKPTANTVSKPAPQQAQAKQSAPAPTQGKPMPSNPQGMRQQGVGKSANDLSRNTTGSSASSPQEKPVAQTKQLGGRSGAAQRIRAKRESEVTQKPTANTVTQPGGGQTKQMSPEMQRRVAQTQVGDNAAKEVNRINPKPGQTVNTRTNNDGSVSSSVTTKKTIGVDPSAGKSDTKSLVNPNKKQNVKNAKNLKKDFTKVDKQTSSMSIDKEPAAQVDVGKFSGPGGF